MYSKLTKLFLKLSLALKDKGAGIQTTELTLLFFVTICMTVLIVVFIMNLLGDGESEEDGGLLKSVKDFFVSKQS